MPKKLKGPACLQCRPKCLDTKGYPVQCNQVCDRCDDTGIEPETLPSKFLMRLATSVQNLSAGVFLLPENFEAEYHLKPETVRDLLGRLIRMTILEPVYRLHAPLETLVRLNQETWTSDLVSLAKVFRDPETGLEIDGGNPDNILVAFKRTAFTI